MKIKCISSFDDKVTTGKDYTATISGEKVTFKDDVNKSQTLTPDGAYLSVMVDGKRTATFEREVG